ncbi:MAG: hypothetical protein HY305_00670, partial [Sphingobacteriales bacterium]|nr:hypothetical protein [Sphingobacteriales bacterium]
MRNFLLFLTLIILFSCTKNHADSSSFILQNHQWYEASVNSVSKDSANNVLSDTTYTTDTCSSKSFFSFKDAHIVQFSGCISNNNTINGTWNLSAGDTITALICLPISPSSGFYSVECGGYYASIGIATA